MVRGRDCGRPRISHGKQEAIRCGARRAANEEAEAPDVNGKGIWRQVKKCPCTVTQIKNTRVQLGAIKKKSRIIMGSRICPDQKSTIFIVFTNLIL